MFRLYDTVTGQARPVQPIRPGELRIWVAGHVASPVLEAAQLRTDLIADLVRRVAERHRLLVTAWHQAPDPEDAARSGQVLQEAWQVLNIYPTDFAASPLEPLDVAVARAGLPADSAGYRMEAGEVRPEAPDDAGFDPLALRLALLEHHYREPAILSREVLEAADQKLRHWRELVADWARSPSKPMCARYTGDILGAFDDDLGTPAAVLSLAALAAAPELPAGSKFESFASYDQLFGLDLARDVGR
jgi:cysteinyl-tRNA synthetase